MIGGMDAAERRVALVTGSSRGLGQAIARRLAADGLAVAVNSRGGDDGAAGVARAITGAGGRAAAFAADVTDEQQVGALVAEVSERLGSISVLVLTAAAAWQAEQSDAGI
jgi:3-oxoacyl-[acyl-carrier protein] reductase